MIEEHDDIEDSNSSLGRGVTDDREHCNNESDFEDDTDKDVNKHDDRIDSDHSGNYSHESGLGGRAACLGGRRSEKENDKQNSLYKHTNNINTNHIKKPFTM